MDRSEIVNVLEKYCDESISNVVAEAHREAIKHVRKSCRNCINSNPHMIKFIGGKRHTFCDMLQFYVDINTNPKGGCWCNMWGIND